MDWVLAAHIALGTLWLGGVMYQEAQAAGARREGSEAYIRTAVRAQVTNARVYPVVTILILATAIWMILARDYLSFGDGWIIASLVLWLIGVLTGILYFTPRAKRMATELEASGPSESLLALVERMHLVERLEIILLLALLVLMVIKPGA